jgi:hypothetical protein
MDGEGEETEKEGEGKEEAKGIGGDRGAGGKKTRKRGGKKDSDNDGYGYLLNMPLRTLSHEKVERLLREKAQRVAYLARLKLVTVKEMWEADLDELDAALEKHDAERRAYLDDLDAEIAESKKSGGGGGSVTTARGRGRGRDRGRGGARAPSRGRGRGSTTVAKTRGVKRKGAA